MKTLAVVGGLVVACLIGLGVWALIVRELMSFCRPSKNTAPTSLPSSATESADEPKQKQPRRKKT